MGDRDGARRGTVHSEGRGSGLEDEAELYIVANNDRTVHPYLERFVAERMGATTYEVESSHVPTLSQPSAVLDVIRTAANAVQDSLATV